VQPDRILKGVITNATKFVDIGVNQDGFDHISELPIHYIKKS
jgi:transcriptional accessory protein Tex/SPT6